MEGGFFERRTAGYERVNAFFERRAENYERGILALRKGRRTMSTESWL